jgi:hypothetical protein
MKIRRHVGADDRQQLAIAGQKPNWDKLYVCIFSRNARKAYFKAETPN